MIPGHDPVIVVNATGPDGSTAARIDWELAEGAAQAEEAIVTMDNIAAAQANASEVRSHL